MDEILELQQQLAAVQQATTAQKLSERNCVELVMKLQSLKLIDLIFTRSGKEYLTPSQLTLEISDELLSRGGRVNIIDLPDALNVELYHIQSAIPHILNPPAIRLVRGELLTDYYLASIAEEINDSITASEHGLDDVGSIASRYALPVDIVRETVSNHLQTVINATLDAQNRDLLRSAASIARDRAATRGLLCAVTVPTMLADLAKARQLPLPLVSELAEELLYTTELTGTIVGRGSRAILVPQVFSDAALQAALSAFASSGFISLERLSKMHISNTSEFVKANLKDAVVLSECIIGPILIDTLATSAAEAVSGDAWLDVEVALPPDFPIGDVSAVMATLVESLLKREKRNVPKEGGKAVRSKRKAKNRTDIGGDESEREQNIAFGDRFIVSPGLTKRFRDRLVTDAGQKATERARVMAEKMSTFVTQTGAEVLEEKREATDNEGGKKSKGKGRRRTAAKDKGVKTGTKCGTAGTVSEQDAEFPIWKPSVEEAIEIIVSDSECSSAIETDYLGSSTAGNEMMSCVIEDVYGEDGLFALYQGKAEEAVATLLRERSIAKKNADKALLADLEQAELYSKSASSLSDEELATASRAFVVNSKCLNALCRIVDSVSQGTGIVDPAAAQACNLNSTKEKLEVLRSTMSKLAPTLETRIRAMMSALNEKENEAVDVFLNIYDESVTLLDLPERRPVDKKAEKTSFANSRIELCASLGDENLSEMKCLQMAAVLVHAKSVGGSIIIFPMQYTVGFCKVIEEKAKPAEAGAALRELRESMTIRNHESNEEIPDRPLQPESRERLTSLMEIIG